LIGPAADSIQDVADNKLFYGDNLEVMANLPSESVDLIYLDPPFNSARNYNVIFSRGSDATNDVAAQIEAFTDTWTWTPVTEEQYSAYVNGGLPSKLVEALIAFRTLLGENDALAYLVKMAPRLADLHRILRSTGSLYLHCDPTMSHYLKIMLDAVFGARFFQNEIIWTYEIGGRSKKRWARKHDVILFYSKSDEFYFDWSAVKVPRKEGTHMRAKTDDDGRSYQEKTDRKSGKVYRYYLDEGAIPPDYWIGIQQLNREASERLGYPTQKPLALLERIVLASSRPGDVVLDPFCGCGTSIDAAQKLGRNWIGIDVTYIAIDLIEKRLMHSYGREVTGTYDVLGIPKDVAGAQALFNHNPFDFERWAVAQVNAQPNEKQVGDKGIDGIARFPLGGKNEFGKILISVKGGKQLNPAMVRDLSGTVETQKAAMGVLITQHEPTRGMTDAVNHAGSYVHPSHGATYPRLQIITVTELLAGKKPDLPPTILPYIAAKAASQDTATPLF
jgi:site-specific DNA-methyltransferase (adenine-specific)